MNRPSFIDVILLIGWSVLTVAYLLSPEPVAHWLAALFCANLALGRLNRVMDGAR